MSRKVRLNLNMLVLYHFQQHPNRNNAKHFDYSPSNEHRSSGPRRPVKLCSVSKFFSFYLELPCIHV